MKRTIRVFRYDPAREGSGHFTPYELEIPDPAVTTILDVLIRLQKEQDPTLAFRYACRVNMCGSCGMVINGREGLACKTNVADLPAKRPITLRPLNHFPVIKDLVTDMGPFFDSYEADLPFFEPKDSGSEPAVIKPDSPERLAIGLNTECIACGCCVSSCTMVNNHPDYSGPASLNRAFTLLLDSRDGLHEQRLNRVLAACYHCRTEFNCTEVCPKEISGTRAIKFIQRLAANRYLRQNPFHEFKSAQTQEALPPTLDAMTSPEPAKQSHTPGAANRRKFLKTTVQAVGAVTALSLGGILSMAAVGPSMTKHSKRLIKVAPMDKLPKGRITTVPLRYSVNEGFYQRQVDQPVAISRLQGENQLTVFNTTCTHLGCAVRWSEAKQLFVCACHGGAFTPDGSVKSGPPPRPLDQYSFKVQDNALFVEVA